VSEVPVKGYSYLSTKLTRSGQGTQRCTPIGLSSDKAGSQTFVAVGLYEGNRVNLLKKYDYPSMNICFTAL